MAVSIAVILNETEDASDSLRRLDRNDAPGSASSLPAITPPRGKHPEQTLYLAQIKDLDCSGFEGDEVAGPDRRRLGR